MSCLSPEIISSEFRNLFAQCGADVEVKILPAILEMGAQSRRIDSPTNFKTVTEEQLNGLKIRRENLMCFNGRSVLKKNGACRVYPCPIIYEVPEYDLGST